ncbi:MAG: type I 3-dehydroquinate dehydratase [Patescibacteria group bacterium]|nr:type I 3-dehydroquinate dehydratase [Patescibacteria group bacterium]
MQQQQIIGKPRICVPVTAPAVDALLESIATLPPDLDFIEIRFDSLEHPTRDAVDVLANQMDPRFIFTCRSVEEGGLFHGFEAERIEIIKHALERGFSHVDIELRSFLAVEPTVPAGTRLILSYHNFKTTPDSTELQDLVNQMYRTPGAIAKIATMARSEEDSRRLLRLLLANAGVRDMICIGMGPAGVVTRIFAAYLGAYLTFAAAPTGATAPGQVPYQDLLRLFAEINNLTNLSAPE